MVSKQADPANKLGIGRVHTERDPNYCIVNCAHCRSGLYEVGLSFQQVFSTFARSDTRCALQSVGVNEKIEDMKQFERKKMCIHILHHVLGFLCGPHWQGKYPSESWTKYLSVT